MADFFRLSKKYINGRVLRYLALGRKFDDFHGFREKQGFGGGITQKPSINIFFNRLKRKLHG